MGKGLTIAGFASAVAGAAMGLLSLLVVWNPVLALLASGTALALSVAGLVLSIIGGKKLKAEDKKSTLATVGLIVGICGCAVSAIIFCACGICVFAAVGMVI